MAIELLGAIQDLNQAIGPVPVAQQNGLQFGVALGHGWDQPGSFKLGMHG
jgi:hypothetical protein